MALVFAAQIKELHLGVADRLNAIGNEINQLVEAPAVRGRADHPVEKVNSPFPREPRANRLARFVRSFQTGGQVLQEIIPLDANPDVG
jgi:hypothetical protein